jgi:hypothetical protein
MASYDKKTVVNVSRGPRPQIRNIREFGVEGTIGTRSSRFESQKDQYERLAKQLGMFDVILYSPAGEFTGPRPYIGKFNTKEERDAFLIEHEQKLRAREQRERNNMRRRFEMQQREAQRQYEAAAAKEEAENEATAQMNCIGRTCKRVGQWISGTHNITGTRKMKMEGGSRRKMNKKRFSAKRRIAKN